MRIFDYFLLICGVLVLGEAAAIITLNTKRGYWQPTNKFHVLSAIFYLVYLTAVIYASVECNRSDDWCDLLWKICSTLYITVTMFVYTFYYAKSKVVNTVHWYGKKWAERFVLGGIASMVMSGLAFFWLPIDGVQYNGLLIDGECRLVKRNWIAVVWVFGDTVLSIFLLILFMKPLREIKQLLGRTPSTRESMGSIIRITEINRNLLFITVLCTLVVMLTIAVVGDLKMRTVIYMCAMDRLITLQCITMTFSYDKRRYFYCYACFLLLMEAEENVHVEEVMVEDVQIEDVPDHDPDPFEIADGQRAKSPSILFMPPIDRFA